LVEFTVTLPVLLVLFALVVEIAGVLRQHQIVNEGVRSATRYLSRVPDPDAAGAIAAARNLALTGSLDGSLPLRSAHWTDASSVAVVVTEVDNSAGIYRGPATIDAITVSTTVTVPVPLVAPMLRLVGGDAAGTLDLSVVDQVRHFGS
jgi:Flp pilus assembly protein TadG